MRTTLIILALGASCNRAPNRVDPPATREPTADKTAPSPTVIAGTSYESDLKKAQDFFATRPLVERPLDVGGEPVEGVGNRSAKTCGACHAAIYKEWSVSTHRHAWNDPQYQKEIQKSGNKWLCVNCHTPTLEQQERWPVGLKEGDVERPTLVANPRHDPELMDEGITCVACHVRDGTIHGPGLPESVAPHPVQADTKFRSGELCNRCHQAEQSYPGKGFVCTFTTGKEWAASPQAAQGIGCVDCHMPTVERPVATGGPVRTVRRHWFKGSGIPKFADAAPPDDALPGPGLSLRATRDGNNLFMNLHNTAGHALPSGDPERWVQVDVTFYDAEDRTLPNPYQVRIGQTWEWHPIPKKVADNRLQPDEQRTNTIPWPAAAERAELRASSHRISRKNADYHKLGDYPRSIETHRFTVR
ncbi:MAG: multiheme c-type cytochrome [Myxococcota bacterium]